MATTDKSLRTTEEPGHPAEPESIEKPDDLSDDKTHSIHPSSAEPTLKPDGPDVIKKGPENEDYEYYYYYYYDEEEDPQGQHKQSQSSDDKKQALYRWIPLTWGEVRTWLSCC